MERACKLQTQEGQATASNQTLSRLTVFLFWFIIDSLFSVNSILWCEHAASFSAEKLINEEIQLSAHANESDSQYCCVYENSFNACNCWKAESLGSKMKNTPLKPPFKKYEPKVFTSRGTDSISQNGTGPCCLHDGDFRFQLCASGNYLFKPLKAQLFGFVAHWWSDTLWCTFTEVNHNSAQQRGSLPWAGTDMWGINVGSSDRTHLSLFFRSPGLLQLATCLLDTCPSSLFQLCASSAGIEKWASEWI